MVSNLYPAILRFYFSFSIALLFFTRSVFADVTCAEQIVAAAATATRISPPNTQVVILGAGPSGIATAIELKKRGVEDVVILEKEKAIVSTIRGYPESKPTDENYGGDSVDLELSDSYPPYDGLSRDETVRYFEELVKKYDLKIQFGEEVRRVEETIDGSFKIYSSGGERTARAAVYSVGIFGQYNQPGWKIPQRLRPYIVHRPQDILDKYDENDQIISSLDVLVVGGGNSAADFVQALLTKGHRVTLSYRRDEFKRMTTVNRKKIHELAREGRINLKLNSDIEGVARNDERLVIEVKFKEALQPEDYNRIVLAIGGSTPTSLMEALSIEQTENKRPVLDGSGASTLPGAFFTGDLADSSFSGNIKKAINSAVRTAEGIVGYLDP